MSNTLARYSITVHTTTFGEWAEHADEPQNLGTGSEVHEFDHLAEVAEYLRSEGLEQLSVEGPGAVYTQSTWLSLPDGSRPTWDGNYTGHTEELSAHTYGYWTDREWSALLTHIANG